MITWNDIIYYACYITCFIFSFHKTKNINGILLLRILLLLGLINEFYVETMQYLGKEENFSHFLYLPAEYCILCLFYTVYSKKKHLKYIILLSIPVYLFLVFFIGLKFYNFKNYPSVVYNLGCILSIVWLTLILFDIELIENISITKIPAFWILCGLLFFYSGIYFFNTAYSFLLSSDRKVASEIRGTINLALNIILYAFWTYAFICSAKIKNSTYL